MEDRFHPLVKEWFLASFVAPTQAQNKAWPPILRGESTLLLAPTGSGKTLSAFLACLDRIMFTAPPEEKKRCRVLYVSPLKALASDVEKNLKAPVVGISQRAAAAGTPFIVPSIAIRTGDTPQRERAQFARHPSDILITTPESLYLLLTSNAREALKSIETVIIDEIHALVPSKRGAHLALSLERLEALAGRKLQRIGLSATQRPLEEVARYLGGTHRPVTCVDAGSRKPLDLTIEVPVEDMSRLGEPIDIPSGPASQGAVRTSIWSAIHPRLLELVKSHRSTLIFVNSRRIAERIAGALNELAGEALVLAHHGSVARPQRIEIEDKLKSGQVKGLVATSSLELGIDMGAVDLVIQIEAPPSVASGMQRIGRAGHQVGGISQGIIFPKFRQDLLSCAALAEAMIHGEVESTRYPRNALDVLAQQIVAMVAMDPWSVDNLYAAVAQAAPYGELTRASFEGVLDMLSGKYPSDDFAELRPRITWDRIQGTLSIRDGARRIAISNGGTIPDRGLYGVYLADGKKGGARVGELDEEMVFECRTGETFVLGASTWRIEDIRFDRVLVSPAPGQPGKMPFWRGDKGGRSIELGRRVGELTRKLDALPQPVAMQLLQTDHALDDRAANNLLEFLREQKEAVGVFPDDQTVVIERYRDELGDYRVCVLTPFGTQIHMPWAMALSAKIRQELGLRVETMWSNDGLVVRFPETAEPPDIEALLPKADELEKLLMDELGGTSLFAAKFREVASRALLLPKRRPGSRAPLWQLRQRAADLMHVAAQYSSFPMMLETYRECLRDVFDVPALVSLMRARDSRQIRTVLTDTTTPSPFAASLLFGYVANYIYDGDAPLAERRAQALSIDLAQLRELLGELELRELLDLDVMDGMSRQLQFLADDYRAKNADGVHDMLLRLGDLSEEEVLARMHPESLNGRAALESLVQARRVVELRICGKARWVAVESAAKYRDALGTPLPAGLPEALTGTVAHPLDDLALRYARTHVPFTTEEFAARYGLNVAASSGILEALFKAGKILKGAFRPGGHQLEWCDPQVLRSLRQKCLSKLRHEVEAVEPAALGRLSAVWHGLSRKGKGADALLDAVERLQGLPLPASILETEILPARVDRYSPSDLDALMAAGEVMWVGVESMGERDGRIALYLTDHYSQLWRPEDAVSPQSPLTQTESQIVEYLRLKGASFFHALHQTLGGGFPGDAKDALWGLVWKGLLTNDSLYALRHYLGHSTRAPRLAALNGKRFRSRRSAPPAAEGRWWLTESRAPAKFSATEWASAVAQQLLSRYGVVTREVGLAEKIPGGFTTVYQVFKALEEAGQIRRGYFIAEMAGMQFAQPAALDLLRSLKSKPEKTESFRLSAVDPANPYGALLPWPGTIKGISRSAGAQVIIVNGTLAAYLSRSAHQLRLFLPENEPDRGVAGRAVAERMAERSDMLIEEIDGEPAKNHPFVSSLEKVGFVKTNVGLHLRFGRVAGEVSSA